MSLLPWNDYFRRFVNRREASLLAPRIFEFYEFTLPKFPVIHYKPHFSGDNGPSMNDPIFKDVKKMMGVTFVDSLKVLEGNPRVVNVVTSTAIREYLNTNNKIKRNFKTESVLADGEAPLIVNYAFADRKYHMQNIPLKEWYMANNWIYTIVEEFVNIYRQGNRSNQFLIVELPKSIPTLARFRQLNQNETISIAKEFNSFEKVLILHLFNLITNGDKKLNLSRNAFGILSKSALDSINIVFVESGYYSILNLGTLMSWVKSIDNPSGKTPKIVQIYLYKFIMGLMKIRTENIEELINHGNKIDTTDSDSITLVEQEVVDDIDSPDENEDIETPKKEDINKDENISTMKVKEDDTHVEDKSFKYDRKLDELVFDSSFLTEDEQEELTLLEKQLEQQMLIKEEIVKKKEAQIVKATKVDLFSEEPLSPEESAMMKVEALMETGTMTPKDYRRFQELADKYKSIPIKNTTLDQFSIINKEDLKVEETKVPDNNNISDKSMLNSTLIEFDRQYTEKIMDKDIARMMVNVQKAGVFITDLETKEIKDTTGHFTDYTLKVQPIKGKSTTVKFKIPVINRDGNFTSNGVEYRLRKQKVDMPIRKISPSRVSLTSSYGKVFIDRTDRKVFNYQKWLTTNIRIASLDKENTRVTETKTSNVFNNNFKVPKLYSMIAMDYSTLKANNIYFYFDYAKRATRFKDLDKVESNGKYVACGILPNGTYLVMDFDDQLYTYVDGKYLLHEDMISLLGLDRSKEPVEIAEMLVMGKSIPIGIILGYKLGFSNLLAKLGVEYQIEEDFHGNKVGDDKYSITFKDKRFIFNKKDKLASLILNGFNAYKNEIRDFNVSFFDGPAVYFNVLDGKKAAGRYLKEVDLAWDLFIDPITLTLLEEMNEPKTFKGLIFRACQLLLVDYHPDEVSAYDMRIRGYEKLPSIVYGELVRAIRMHNNKAVQTASGITVGVNDVLLKFLNDPGNVLVEDINPFQDIRQIEAVSYVGVGGRSKDTMVKRTRKFHEGDLGVVSEATVDSSDVGINIYTTANPQFTSVYGTTKPVTEELKNGKIEIPKLMSTVFTTMPCIEKDD